MRREAYTPLYESAVTKGAIRMIEVKGVRLLDWVKNAVNDVKVETVDCDPDCGTP